MSDDPLALPRDHRVLLAYAEQLALTLGDPPRTMLPQLLRSFARLPYENLTKIIKHAEQGWASQARRGPAEVVADYARYGAGGTCFSLTATLLHLLRAAGWRAEPILADRSYGANTHSALLVWLDGSPHLVDPGYLIVDPIPLAGEAQSRVITPFNELLLHRQAGHDRIELWTVQEHGPRYRLTFKTTPADPSEFLRAWDASFSWDMMRYPLLTRVTGNRQLYLRGGRLQSRTHQSLLRAEIVPAELPKRIAAEFGVAGSLVERALAVLKRRGETTAGERSHG